MAFRKTPTPVQAQTQQAQQQTAFVTPSSTPPPEPEEEENPLEVTDAVEVGSLADQESDVLQAANQVLFIVKKASIKVNLIDNDLKEGDRLTVGSNDVNTWKTKSLHLELSIHGQKPDDNGDGGSGGIDGQGSYVGRNLFCDLWLALNDEGTRVPGTDRWTGNLAPLRLGHARKVEQEIIQHGKQTSNAFNETWWRTKARYQTKLFYSAIGFDVKLPVPPADDSFLINLVGCIILADITKVKDDFRGPGEFKNEVKNFRAVEG